MATPTKAPRPPKRPAPKPTPKPPTATREHTIDFDAALPPQDHQYGEIDFSAPLHQDPITTTTAAETLESAMKNLRKSKKTNKTKTLPKKTPKSPINDNNIYNIDGSNTDLDMSIDSEHTDKIDSVSLRDKLTLQELKFLEIYLGSPLLKGKDRMTINKAMILAGYGEFTQYWRYRLAQKIVIKYERQADDAAKIFQDIGFGQVSIAKGIKRLAEDANSEMVQLNAHGLAAKCTRMTQEPEQTFQGIQIVVTCSAEDRQELPPGHARPAQVVISGGEQTPPKPLQLTK